MGTYWALTDKCLLELQLHDEQRGIWRVHLERGDYEAALEHCDTAAERTSVLSMQADVLFKNGDFLAAAETYNKINVPFEAIVLKFLHAYDEADGTASASGSAAHAAPSASAQPVLGQRLMSQFSASGADAAASSDISVASLRRRHDLTLALRALITARLALLHPEDRTHLTLLCAWLLELYLNSVTLLEASPAADAAAAGPSDDPDTDAALALPAATVALRQELYESECQALLAFLEEYHDCLHPPTTLDLIGSYGRDRELLIYAGLVGDTGLVVDHHLRRGEPLLALKALHALRDKLRYAPRTAGSGAPMLPARDCELIYRAVPLLLPLAPAATVDLLIAAPGLDLARLLPALVRCGIHCERAAKLAAQRADAAGTTAMRQEHVYESLAAAGARDTITELTSPGPDTRVVLSGDTAGFSDEVLRYLRHAITHGGHGGQPAAPQAAHHLYLALLCAARHVDALMSYVADPRYQHCYDPLFALRLCRTEGAALVRVAVELYLRQHMFSEAIHLALAQDQGLARRVLIEASESLQERPALLKRLWLSYAEVLVSRGVSVRDALSDAKSGSGRVSLANLLQCLPGMSSIRDVRDEVLAELEAFANEITALKDEMGALTASNAAVRDAMTALKQQAGSVLSNQCCDLCGQPVLLSSFMYFSCTHAFHVNCIVKQAKKYLDADTARKTTILEGLLEDWSAQRGGPNDNPPQSLPALSSLGPDEQEMLVEEFAQSSCCLCGDMMIHSVNEPFIHKQKEKDDVESWRI
jgi:hypothetical protein